MLTEPVTQIDGTTKLLAIIGDPIAQAKTPGMINPILASGKFGPGIVLVPMQVAGSRLSGVVQGLRGIVNFRGAVVTCRTSAICSHCLTR